MWQRLKDTGDCCGGGGVLLYLSFYYDPVFSITGERTLEQCQEKLFNV